MLTQFDSSYINSNNYFQLSASTTTVMLLEAFSVAEWQPGGAVLPNMPDTHPYHGERSKAEATHAKLPSQGLCRWLEIR